MEKEQRKRYCNIKELSKYIGLPKGTLYDWSSQSLIPSIKIGRRVLFDLQDIDDLLEKLKRNVVTPKERANAILNGER